MTINNQEYQIIWQKWSNPFGSEEELDYMHRMLDAESSSFTEEDLEEMYQEEMQEESAKDMSVNKLRVVATPMGIMPLTENTDICHIFNFWIGHANFDITSDIVSIIEAIEGVETLDVFTRYRFRIGVGKAFIDSEVMRNINDQIYEYLDAP
jgi:hypothetical protein